MTRKRRRTIILLLAAGVGLLGSGLGLATWHVWAGHRAFHAAVDRWRETGGVTRVEGLLTANEGVARASNAAAVYSRAFEGLPILERSQQRRISAVWRDGTAVPDRVAQLVASHGSALDAVARGARREACRWPVAYDTTDPPRNHLSRVETAIQLLLAETAIHLRAGRRGAGVDRFETALALCDDLRADPALVTHLLRRRMQVLLLEACERLFAERPMPARELLDRLTGPGVRASFCRALNAKGAMWLLQWRNQRRERSRLFRYALDAELASDTRAYLGAIADLRAYFARPYAEAHEAGPITKPPRWAYALRAIRRGRERINRKLAAEVARRRLAETALRLAAHKRETGAYPARLAALGSVPRDPFTGGKLDYRRRDRGFRLLAGGGGRAGEWHRRR